MAEKPRYETGHMNTHRAADCAGISTIDDLAELRSTLEIWVDRAAQAVWKFARTDDGSFWTNSEVAEVAARAEAKEKAKGGVGNASPPHVTTTARSFVALQNAHRSRGDDTKLSAQDWVALLAKFTSNFPINVDAENNFAEEGAKAKVNIFDIAHLADFFQVAEYADRFGLQPKTLAKVTGGAKPEPNGEDRAKSTGLASMLPDELRKGIVARLTDAIEAATIVTGSPLPHIGEVRFDDRAESAHFFATLHSLRALHALGAPLPANIAAVVEGARSFAVEQCFYYHRGATHRQDALRLAFACSIYSIYGDHVDEDLCLAIVEALHQAQQDNGSWPATHPILRENGRPWHIASHEVALCLTWLYFQPKMPDAARPQLVSMLRRYLLDAVAPTFFRAPTTRDPEDLRRMFDGWQDDQTVGTQTTVGWATAIICHFLANFSHVLDDWINRRVIEDLDLQLVTEGYIIDDVVGSPAPRWQRRLRGTNAAPVRVERRDTDGLLAKEDGEAVHDEVPRDTGEVWPDLPPHAWSSEVPNEARLASNIYSQWTDPTSDNAISKAVAKLILLPIFSNADQRPERDRYAGLLPGKPGTRKTSLVDKIAEAVMWPKVAVPASLIFAKGFDMMEAQANAVFDRLNHLRRCVIFFDEFEEFFVKRQDDTEKADPVDKQRTIAAFTTSAMLPRLQQLHDKRQCLIFLATNGIDKIDSAIKRRGRFDFMIQVDHPTAERMIEYLDALPEKTRRLTKLDQLRPEVEAKVIAAVTKALKGDKSREEVRFAWVEQLLETFRNVEDSGFEAAVEAKYKMLVATGDEENPPRIENLLDQNAPPAPPRKTKSK